MGCDLTKMYIYELTIQQFIICKNNTLTLKK